MVTASYLTGPMQELHEAAVQAGVTIVNEVVQINVAYTFAIKVLLKNDSLMCTIWRKTWERSSKWQPYDGQLR